MNAFLTVLIVALMATFITCSLWADAYAQGAALKEPTTGKSLDVAVEIGSSPVQPNDETKFKITFLQHGTDKVQPYVDYYFEVLKDGKQIFRVPADQPLLHTPDGNATIFYKFDSGGNYTVAVTVAGIAFKPIKPESASFPVQVAPEFPAGIAGMGAAAALALVVGSSPNKWKTV